jgi:RNA polymerase sigma factor (sigma-70 family)
VSSQPTTPLIEAYFVRREELKRFFAARFGSAEQAEDLVQDLYLKVASLDPGQVVDNPGGYLYRLAMNLMLDHVRQQARNGLRDGAWRQAHTHALGGEDIADEPPIEDAISAKRRLADMVAGVDALPEKTRKVFRLHKFEGLTHAQTAARLGMSQRMVEKHVRAALKTLLLRIGRS